MCKSEIFNRILNTVSQETEITIDEILSRSHRKEIVDARYLFVYFYAAGVSSPPKSPEDYGLRRKRLVVSFANSRNGGSKATESSK